MSIVLIKKYRREHGFLLSLLLLISVGLVLRLGYSPAFYSEWVKWLLLSDVTILLFGPIFYGFVRSALKLRIDHRYYWLHFLPAVLFLIRYSLKVLPFTAAEVIELEGSGVNNSFYTLFYVVSILSSVAYLVFAFKAWMNRSAKKDSYGILKTVLVFNAIIIFCWLATFLVATFWPEYYWITNYGYQIAFLLLSSGAIAISYQALTSTTVFSKPLLETKYSKSSLTDVELNKWSYKLESAMKEEAFFLDSTLTLEKLGKEVNLNKTQLSEVINRAFNKGFAEWVNEYRINEFIRRVESDDFGHLTFIGIATEVGFNTKANFNKAFKKSKGQTPSQYFASNMGATNALLSK
ncbi:hypothetical protein BFP71_06500 [Roseivirga misakiensis]|uniref:HTH araC/xylS-type domain-containing protein n=1 Tax=Roseivirga misakiensis TaxID=1563681 RepID=A0A1E5T3B9_9BACT|nr:hypothetical protein BFP71_06500 [Roseivirga misakiensis]